MTLTPADLDRLDALAAVATPGEWRAMGHEVVTGDVDLVADTPGLPGEEYETAAYIAALSPATVTELVAMARTASGEAAAREFLKSITAPADLDAAWRAVEAALPEGWVTGLIGIAFGTGRWYTASAYVDLMDYADDHDADYAQGPTPAAALLALAAALRELP